MSLFQLILISFFDGLFDSVKNIFIIFSLDREMNKKLTENSGSSSETSKKSNKEKKWVENAKQNRQKHRSKQFFEGSWMNFYVLRLKIRKGAKFFSCPVEKLGLLLYETGGVFYLT
jgi:hypothetical protein